jgi:TamB, inner membrane protein subunit of TAM complex
LRPKKKNRFTRIFIWIFSIVLLNIIALVIFLQVPAIQTRLAQYLSRILSGKTGFNITVKEVDIQWVDRFSLGALSIVDENDETLLTLESLDINYKLASVLKKHITLDNADIDGLEMKLYKEENDTFNLTKLINRIKEINKKSGNKSSVSLRIDKINISNSNFYFLKNEQAPSPRKFSASNFNLADIEGELQSLLIVSDTFKVEVVSLSAIEKNTSTKIHSLRTKFLVSPRSMRFDSLFTHFGNSKINKNLTLKYSGYEDLSHFTDSVYLNAELNKAILTGNDLSLFSSYFENINDKYILSGSFYGKVSDFKVKNFNLALGQGSNLSGNLYFSGLPDISETFIDINLSSSAIHENDIVQYIPSEAFKSYNRFSKVRLNGSFTGYVGDFVASGNFKTNLGTIISDINLKLSTDPTKTEYIGKIQLIDFELGNYLENKYLGKITLNGQVKGKGINMANANIIFDGAVDSLSIRGYTYSNIKTSGTFEKAYFSGLLAIDDPNLRLQTQNKIDLRENVNKVSIKGELDYAHLNNLGLLQGYAWIKSKIDADFSGFALDSIVGYVHLENLYAVHKEHELHIESLTLNSEKENGQRSVELITDKANVLFWGDFDFTTAYRDLKFVGHELLLSLINNKDSIANFYANQPTIALHDKYSISGKARFKKIDSFLQLFVPTLSTHNSTEIDFGFNHGEANSLSVQVLNDTISYDGNTFVNNRLNIDASKFIEQPRILAIADIQSAEQLLRNGAKLNDLMVSAVWDENKIDFNWYHKQLKIDNINDLYGEIYFYPDSTQIHLKKSNLSLLNEVWSIQDDNYITIVNQNIIIQNLNLSSNSQLFTVAGVISRDPKKALLISARDLEIGTINPLITKKLSGRLSGEFAISDLYHTPTIISNFYIDAFGINQFLIGNIYSSNDWNNDKKLFDIQLVVNRNDAPIILVNGIFNPFDKDNALDLRASFMNAKINMAEPFVETLFSKLEGGITGNLHITGSLQSPNITGKGAVSNARLRVNYLNTFYDVEGSWALDSSVIYLNDWQLTDINKNKANLGGKFMHSSFRNFSLDLSGTMQDFLVLSTTASDNDLFYGTGIVSGAVSFTGPIEDITIKAQATTGRNTKFYIPIGGSNSSEFEDYISFIDFSDTLQNIQLISEQKVKVTGLNLEFDLEITEDAYSEIIFDITSGDIIRGRGNGHLSLKIDTKGEFSMLGDYEFVSGGYNFTMYNIVNKEFTINPKSKISWAGDPYGGVMDIDASYKLSTSLAPLVDTAYKDMPDVKRIYPTEVRLSLDGPLLTPDIGFKIIIDDYPKSNVDLDTQVKGFLNTIATDQQELNRQVFSLLILRKFSAPNSFSSSGTIGSSVSEFVSNQLSYWISQVDENLTIDMDLGELDADALSTFQLRVSYQFMDGKLIVTRDGGFTDPNNEASVSSIAGDWTLEYLLSEDGKLRIKLFNKTNYNQLNSTTGSASQALLSGGFSLIYTTSFDNFKELFENKKKKDKRKINTEPSTSALKREDNLHEDPKK